MKMIEMVKGARKIVDECTNVINENRDAFATFSVTFKQNLVEIALMREKPIISEKLSLLKENQRSTEKN